MRSKGQRPRWRAGYPQKTRPPCSRGFPSHDLQARKVPFVAGDEFLMDRFALAFPEAARFGLAVVDVK